jgi:hypothetical protein
MEFVSINSLVIAINPTEDVWFYKLSEVFESFLGAIRLQEIQEVKSSFQAKAS